MRVTIKFTCDHCGQTLEIPFNVQGEADITKTMITFYLRKNGWMASDERCRCIRCKNIAEGYIIIMTDETKYLHEFIPGSLPGFTDQKQEAKFFESKRAAEEMRCRAQKRISKSLEVVSV